MNTLYVRVRLCANASECYRPNKKQFELCVLYKKICMYKSTKTLKLMIAAMR